MPRSCADAGPWEPFMGYVRGLQCRECKAEYPPVRLAVCESCFGPLEVRYEIDAVRGAFRRDVFGDRPATLWRERELLPLFQDKAIGLFAAGETPPPGAPGHREPHHACALLTLGHTPYTTLLIHGPAGCSDKA